MAQDSETEEVSSPPPSSLTVLAMEGKMRDKIRELQERRAAAMRTEIADLQRERDVAVSHVKKIDKMLTEIKKENISMKKSVNNERTLLFNIKAVERSLLEEQLVSDNLRKKLHGLEKKNKELISKMECRSPYLVPNRGLQHKDRSHSLSELQNNGSEPHQLSKDIFITSPPDQQRVVILKQSPSPSPSPSNSPSVVHRRYKLATTSTYDQETQTDTHAINPSDMPGDLPRPVLKILASAREDILILQNQKKDLQKRLQLAKVSNEDKEKKMNITLKQLQDESVILKEGLSQFSQWVQQKISVVEEDMDICKVIYSLHGSLAKESKSIEELREKLVVSNQTLKDQAVVNKQLTQALIEAEEKLKESQTENRELKEQLQLALRPSPTTLADLKLHTSHSHTLSLPSPLLRHQNRQHRHRERSPTESPVMRTSPRL